MRVLIVSKTRMWEAFCVGGLLKETNENIRLMQPDGFNQPLTTPYEVGQVWDIDFTKREDLILPHCEDVIVQHGTCLGHVKNIEETLLELVDVWQGSPDNLFEGLLRFTGNGSGYISHRIGVPEQSVGFWITDKSLHKEKDGDKVRYHVANHAAKLAYVGAAESIEVIPTGTLLRVSLARWWRPSIEVEERCYLQLSGWYL